MRQFLLLIACLFSSLLKAQDYQSGFRQINFIDPLRSGRSVPADVYYPTTVGGQNVPLVAGAQSFPVVVFGHGFLIPTSAYKWLGDSLSRYGFISVFPATESNSSPNHASFGADLSFLASRVTSLNDSAASFLFGRVKKRAAVAGHSMGGGSSFLSAASGPSVLSALFNFAAAETNPSAQQAASQVNLPSLIFSGSGDCIVPPSTQKAMYNSISYPCKSYINITGGLHCHFSANDGTCALGQLFSGCNSSGISSQVVFQKVISVLVPFLDLYLNENCSSSLFTERYLALTGSEKERICATDPKGCTLTGLNSLYRDNTFSIYPNPVDASESILLRLISDVQHTSYAIYTTHGKAVQKGKLRGGRNQLIHLKDVIPGIYLMQLITQSGKIENGFFIVK